jgi:hypothetical protein
VWTHTQTKKIIIIQKILQKNSQKSKTKEKQFSNLNGFTAGTPLSIHKHPPPPQTNKKKTKKKIRKIKNQP